MKARGRDGGGDQITCVPFQEYFENEASRAVETEASVTYYIMVTVTIAAAQGSSQATAHSLCYNFEAAENNNLTNYKTLRLGEHRKIGKRYFLRKISFQYRERQHIHFHMYCQDGKV